MIYKIYTGSDYPAKFEADEIINPLSAHSTLTDQAEEADFFLFPVNYEKLYGYTQNNYEHYGYTTSEINALKESLNWMVAAAKLNDKKIILLYYFDPIEKIDVNNAVVFRTSLSKSTKSNNEFALPAYTKDLRKLITANHNIWLKKTENPTVGFRGQSAPVKLPVKLAMKRQVNEVLKYAGISKKFKLHYNFGYLARRDAIVSCLNNKNIQTDITLTTMEQSWNPDPAIGKLPFINNIFNNQYNICVSGHGNYSFRLYETLSAGRIPIFINTDCVLPFEDFIDWKKHVVWIEEKDAAKTDQLLLDFHQSKHPDDFLELQKNNRALWEQHLSKEGFFKSLHHYFPVILDQNL